MGKEKLVLLLRELRGDSGERVAMLKGDEYFQEKGEIQSFSVLDFWRWNGSGLLDNTMRGMLAEYLVAKAIGAKESVRQEWAAWDLTARSGAKIEVKSSAYLQNWKQNKLSLIRFGIQPTKGWNPDTGTYLSEVKRQADYYVFCLFEHTERATADPLRLEQWSFYVLPVELLNRRHGAQKSIGLSGIVDLGAKKLTWGELCVFPFC